MYILFYLLHCNVKLHLLVYFDYFSTFVYFILLSSRDGVPYCEQDYQAEFGVTCAGCGGYITGKVLQVSHTLHDKF